MAHRTSDVASSVVLVLDAGTEDTAQLGRLLARVCDYFGADRLYTVASPTLDDGNVPETHFKMSA